MGILNATPDSFYDGGKYTTDDKIIEQVHKMAEEGACIVDAGGCSSRPGSVPPPENEELKRVIPVIKKIRKEFPDLFISIDTFRSEVARQAADAGVDIINDISGGTEDRKMFDTVALMHVPYVLTHIQGNPETMQHAPSYKDIITEMTTYFRDAILKLNELGVYDIILDPGFGFGKTIEHNYEILSHFSTFNMFGLPLLAGISRKGMIQKVLGVRSEESLNGTTAANTIALMHGAKILRVHDVKEAVQAITIVQHYNSAKSNKKNNTHTDHRLG